MGLSLGPDWKTTLWGDRTLFAREENVVTRLSCNRRQRDERIGRMGRVSKLDVFEAPRVTRDNHYSVGSYQASEGSIFECRRLAYSTT